MAAVLITVAMAKDHLLRPDLSDTNPNLLQQMAAAEAAIVTYIASSSDYWRDVVATWTDPTTVPPDVQHAILLMVAQLWRFRGDETGGILDRAPTDEWSDMTPTIVRLLRRWRDPVIA